jgi:hypothetical protein
MVQVQSNRDAVYASHPQAHRHRHHSRGLPLSVGSARHLAWPPHHTHRPNRKTHQLAQIARLSGTDAIVRRLCI